MSTCSRCDRRDMHDVAVIAMVIVDPASYESSGSKVSQVN